MSFLIIRRDLGTGVTINVDNFALPEKYAQAVLLGVAIYNALEVLAWIFIPQVYFTFPMHRGLYFWSVTVADIGVLVHACGIVLNNFQLMGSQTFPVTLSITGWLPMVYAQSLVLYSRLHLVRVSRRIRKYALTIIVLNGIIIGTSTVVTSAGANGLSAGLFLYPYTIVERIQVTAFFLQELVLSSLYVWQAWKFLRRYRQRKSQRVERKLRVMMIHLIISNVVVIVLDIITVALQFSGLYVIQLACKAFVYSAKLKCELGILGRLVDFVKTASARAGTDCGHHHNHHHHHHHHHHPCPDIKTNRSRWPHRRLWPQRHHRCCGDAHCTDIENDGGVQLSSQTEREWEKTLRITFGVAPGEGDECDDVCHRDGNSEKKTTAATGNGNGLSRSAYVDMSRQQQQAPRARGGEHDAHPGTKVPGLCTIGSTVGEDEGENRPARGSVDGEPSCGGGEEERKKRMSVLSTRGGAAVGPTSYLWTEWSLGRSTPPIPERSHLRNQVALRLKGERL